VLTIADCASIECNRGIKRALLWFFWFWIPIRRARYITAISQFTKDRLLASLECPPEKIVTIHCPVSAAFRPKPKPFRSEDPVLLQMGTDWNKNLPRVAEALRGIRCRLIVVGAMDEAQRQCLAGNGIQYTQYQGISEEKLVGIYEGCDLLLFASLYEGFGLPIVEAQAVGRPVLTSNRCSMPEVAGDAACLVDPESAESIRQGVLKILEDQSYRDGLIERGFENVKRFAAARIAAQYAELYREMTQ
jgi:glycosyltransferase involved in cell wall biosynthesis